MRSILIIWLFLLSTFRLTAQVNTGNGLFYVSYEDISFPGSSWSLGRGYNSFSVDKGIFGMGWGTELSTRLWPLPDGQLLVIRFGSGTGDLYLSPQFDQAGLYLMIDSIISDETRQNKLERSPKEIMRRRSELVVDASDRANAYVRLCRRRSIDRQAEPPLHTKKWVNEYRELETIQWENGSYHLDQYYRHYYFDSSGWLHRLKNPDDEVVFSYTGGYMRSVLVNGRDSATFDFNEKGLVRSIKRLDSISGIQEACFEYDSTGLLVRSIDIDANLYEYAYDPNYNMISIRYTNGSYRRMEYDAATNRIIAFRERNGDSSRYEYGYMFLADGRINPDHYYTRTQTYDSSGATRFNRYEETEFRLSESGERYRYRMVEISDTSHLINLYPPNVGNVIYRRVNDREAWSAYDSKTRPIYLRVKDSVYTTRYNLIGLPERFQAIDSVRRDTVTYRYLYDTKGQLSVVFRNLDKYLVQGSVANGVVTLVMGNRKWSLGFLNGQPDYIVDPITGRSSLKDIQLPEQAGLRSQLYDLLRLVIPQRIEHEWIWERMND